MIVSSCFKKMLCMLSALCIVGHYADVFLVVWLFSSSSNNMMMVLYITVLLVNSHLCLNQLEGK